LNSLKELLVNTIDPDSINKFSDIQDLQNDDNSETVYVRHASEHTFRVLDWLEKDRFTSESLTYLSYLEQIGIINSQNREDLLENLLRAESNTIIRPNEIRWAILGMLDVNLTFEQQTFLDFVLSQDLNSQH